MASTPKDRDQDNPSLLRRIRDWAAWEFDRPIEVTPAIRFITIERFFKAVILIGGGIALLVFGHKTDIHKLAEEFQRQYNLTPDRGWVGKLYQSLLKRLGNLTPGTQAALAAGAILYGLLEALEGFGLLLRRRWAEYLVLIATAAFLPLEIEELIRKPTLFKAGAFLVNIFIIVYLIWRKRLFMERPGHVTADRTEPVPPDLIGRPSK